MIAHPWLLVAPAEAAGIALPPNPKDFDKAAFPHWAVYCGLQLGAGMPSADSHWQNAKVIAEVPEAEIRLLTPAQAHSRGFRVR